MTNLVEDKAKALASLQKMIRSNERRLRQLREAEEELLGTLPPSRVTRARRTVESAPMLSPTFAVRPEDLLLPVSRVWYPRESQRAIRE